MRNSKETLEKIRFHKERAEGIKIAIKKLEGELAVENRLILSLDEARSARLAKAKFKKTVEHRVRAQDQVVCALRELDATSHAGDICRQMKKYGINIHGSEFANLYIDHVRADKRVIIKEINSTLFEYSLREWNGKK